MMEAWNIKPDDDRHEDSLPTFIIFCEDEVSEPIYFRYFETSSIKVNSIGGQKSKLDNVVRAIYHCTTEDLIENVEGTPIFKMDEGIQVWCVFDRDIEETTSREEGLGNISFNEAIEIAKRNGIKVAWSNDAFELWILLHFEEVDTTNSNNKNRKTYYNKLTAIFRSLPSPNEDLIKILSRSSFDYKEDMKHKNNFRNIVREEIVGKTYTAIERAKKLEEYHNTFDNFCHEKSPCTLVHHLVEELLSLGKKEIK